MELERPEVHFIGEVAGAFGFSGGSLFCEWQILAGNRLQPSTAPGERGERFDEEDDTFQQSSVNAWTLLMGDDCGTTHTDSPKGAFYVWEHPLDVFYACNSISGWPRMLFRVWSQDYFGRNQFAGYGVTTLPMSPGHFELEIPCWKPLGTLSDRMKDFFLGGAPRLKNEEVIITGEDRFRLHTISSGIVQIRVSVLTRGFDQFGVIFKPSSNVSHAHHTTTTSSGPGRSGFGGSLSASTIGRVASTPTSRPSASTPTSARGTSFHTAAQNVLSSVKSGQNAGGGGSRPPTHRSSGAGRGGPLSLSEIGSSTFVNENAESDNVVGNLPSSSSGNPSSSSLSRAPRSDDDIVTGTAAFQDSDDENENIDNGSGLLLSSNRTRNFDDSLEDALDQKEPLSSLAPTIDSSAATPKIPSTPDSLKNWGSESPSSVGTGRGRGRGLPPIQGFSGGGRGRGLSSLQQNRTPM